MYLASESAKFCRSFMLVQLTWFNSLALGSIAFQYVLVPKSYRSARLNLSCKVQARGPVCIHRPRPMIQNCTFSRTSRRSNYPRYSAYTLRSHTDPVNIRLISKCILYPVSKEIPGIQSPTCKFYMYQHSGRSRLWG